MPKTERLAQRQSNESNLRTLRRRLVLCATIGTLVPVVAFSAIAAIACEPVEGLPNSPLEISTHCSLPGDRSLDFAIGGLEPIPRRQIHAFEIFSVPNDGKLPLRDVHIQIWWETTNGFPSFPQDLPPIIRIRIGR